MLADLMSKNKEEERAKEEKAQGERERRGQSKRRALRDKDQGQEQEQDQEQEGHAEAGAEEDDVQPYANALAAALGVGSALSAVRQRHSRSEGDDQPGPSRRNDGIKQAEPPPAAPGAGGEQAVLEGAEGIDEAEREAQAARKQQAQAQKARVAAYLLALADQKRKDESERRKAAERVKRRAQILSNRIVSESNERKAMSLEDKPRHRALAAEKDQDKATGVSARAKPQPHPPAAPRRPPATAPAPSSSASYSASASAPAAEGTAAAKPAPPVAVADKEKTFKLPPKVVGGATITADAAEALFQRLKARQAKTAEGIEAMANSSVPARDFADWKRKNAVPADGLVFAMTGWYPCVKQALLDRGWFFNADATSPFFDLKWTLRSMETDQDLLQPWQLTNHFMKNVAITTKVGLIKSLQGLVWLADVEANDVIPRGYDLSIPQELQAFMDDFRCQRAEGVLKRVYEKATGVAFPPVDILGAGVPATTPHLPAQAQEEDEDEEESDEESDEDEDEEEEGDGKSKNRAQKAKKPTKPTKPTKPNPGLAPALAIASTTPGGGGGEGEGEWIVPQTPRLVSASGRPAEVNKAVFRAACEVMEQALNPTNDAFLDAPLTKEQQEDGASLELVSALQWEVLNSLEIFACTKGLAAEAEVPVDAFLQDSLSGDKHGGLGGEAGSRQSAAAAAAAATQRRRLRQRAEAGLREAAHSDCKQMVVLTEADLQRVHHLLCSAYRSLRSQSRLNGKGSEAHNIWIVKPAAKSRGRGITTFNDLPRLLKYVDAGTGGSQASQWIVQKYMENPLTIANHKFDLRQWVLVTDWNPLTVYFYDECYARFSVEEYSTKEADLDNAFVHLVNNSISKNSEAFHKKVTAENGEEIEGFMWSHDQFSSYIQHRSGKDLMASKIQPRMRDIARWSLMCASECIEHRKNSWELYGFDFMVDDSYNAWLIEINSSPACDYSTTVTERYVKKALVELLSVTLDVRAWDQANKKTRGERPDTGGWEMIHKGRHCTLPLPLPVCFWSLLFIVAKHFSRGFIRLNSLLSLTSLLFSSLSLFTPPFTHTHTHAHTHTHTHRPAARDACRSLWHRPERGRRCAQGTPSPSPRPCPCPSCAPCLVLVLVLVWTRAGTGTVLEKRTSLKQQQLSRRRRRRRRVGAGRVGGGGQSRAGKRPAPGCGQGHTSSPRPTRQGQRNNSPFRPAPSPSAPTTGAPAREHQSLSSSLRPLCLHIRQPRRRQRGGRRRPTRSPHARAVAQGRLGLCRV